MATKIKVSLLFTVYNSSQNENPLEAANFSIGVEQTEFKLINFDVNEASTKH